MTRSIKLILSGGLGNQLFQICAGIYLEKNKQFRVIYDVSNLLGNLKSMPGNYTRQLGVSELLEGNEVIFKKNHWTIDLLKTKIKKKYLESFYVYEKNSYDTPLLRVSSKTKSVSGFFQDSQLVEETWETLRIKLEGSDKFSPLIYSPKINRIAIHLRFGDYSDDPKTKAIYGLSKKSYYLQALKLFENENECPKKLIVVTDDVTRARNFLTENDFNGTIEYVSNSAPVDDLLEIAQSSHVIMSNSTFSWWGAWIGYKIRASKVIYPRPWLADNLDPDSPIFVNTWTSIKREFESS